MFPDSSWEAWKSAMLHVEVSRTSWRTSKNGTPLRLQRNLLLWDLWGTSHVYGKSEAGFHLGSCAGLNFKAPTRIQQQCIPVLLVSNTLDFSHLLQRPLASMYLVLAFSSPALDLVPQNMGFVDWQSACQSSLLEIFTCWSCWAFEQAGRDALVNAPTGSGKTLAYLAPIVNYLQVIVMIHVDQAPANYLFAFFLILVTAQMIWLKTVSNLNENEPIAFRAFAFGPDSRNGECSRTYDDS